MAHKASATPTWPPESGLTTKIVPRENAVVIVSYSTAIEAPAALVFDAVLHVAAYAEWNTWIPTARIVTQPLVPDADPSDFSHMRVGSIVEFKAVMDARKPDSLWTVPLKVVDICTPHAPTSYLSPELLQDHTFTADLDKVYRVSWTGHGGMYSFGLNLERFHEIIVKGPEECELRTWEVMGGMLALAVKWTQGATLKDKVALWCEDLKRHCEARRGAGP